MPKHDSLNVHVGTSQDSEGLGAVRRIETDAMLGRERAGTLAIVRGMTVALPHRVHDAYA
jgi:hypothetical protein